MCSAHTRFPLRKILLKILLGLLLLGQHLLWVQQGTISKPNKRKQGNINRLKSTFLLALGFGFGLGQLPSGTKALPAVSNSACAPVRWSAKADRIALFFGTAAEALMLVPQTLLPLTWPERSGTGSQRIGTPLSKFQGPSWSGLEVLKHFVEAMSGVVRILKQPNIDT